MVWLTYYCLLIVVASVVGGLVPTWYRLTHRWMEMAVSFVAGIIFGIAALHMLPHALQAVLATKPDNLLQALMGTMLWFVTGFVAMFLIERFFCFHHHEAPADGEFDVADPPEEHDCAGCGSTRPHSDHVHDITWSGAAIGLTLHSLLAGVALAASVQHGSHGMGLPGLGVFLVIFLHKPFDAMTLATLLARSGWSLTMQCTINGLFALAVPAGALLFGLGIDSTAGPMAPGLSAALAFSAGMFLCIAGSDLLPELQFHHHDRWKLSAALLAGLAVAYAAGRLEGSVHRHSVPPALPAPSDPRE